ncbi:MAG: hypothetical protein R3E10_06690 [Gemmatimonadota bacterium]
MFTTAQVLILLAAVAGSGGMAAGAALLWVRLRRVERERLSREVLEGEVRALQEHLVALEDHVERLGARVEFTERLLSPGAGGPPTGP